MGDKLIGRNYDVLNGLICHRIPERTFKINGNYFPICSRCTGIYIGAFSYFMYVYFFYVEYNITLILMSFLMIIPTFLDGLTQFFEIRESNNLLRASKGLISGIGLAIIIKTIKYFLICGN